MHIKFSYLGIVHIASFEDFNSWMTIEWNPSKPIDFQNPEVQEALFDLVSAEDGLLDDKQISLLEQMPRKKFGELFSMVEEVDVDG